MSPSVSFRSGGAALPCHACLASRLSSAARPYRPSPAGTGFRLLLTLTSPAQLSVRPPPRLLLFLVISFLICQTLFPCQGVCPSCAADKPDTCRFHLLYLPYIGRAAGVSAPLHSADLLMKAAFILMGFRAHLFEVSNCSKNSIYGGNITDTPSIRSPLLFWCGDVDGDFPHGLFYGAVKTTRNTVKPFNGCQVCVC